MRLYNTQTRQLEEMVPHEPRKVHMYTCGPTVYRDAHIGNFRSYLMADWLRRALETQGYRVLHVKNITDVGHMRQDMLRQGEDKIIAAALAEGKTPNQIADYYTQSFHQDEARLNIMPAHHFPRATNHVSEVQCLITRLVSLGLAYKVRGNVYFAVGQFPGYGKLSGNLSYGLREAVRVKTDHNKRDPRDFALWKSAEPGRTNKWTSPWGTGFPGWHIECSAMAMTYLGEQLDIHTGGVDNIFPHHEGEIAQSEAATGKPFVKYWVHGQHLLADNVKMSKSMGNSYTLNDLIEHGYDPLAFRYLCLTAHYQSKIHFSFSALRGAQNALIRLRQFVSQLARQSGNEPVSPHLVQTWCRLFWGHVNDNLHLPKAMAVVWNMLRSSLPAQEKLRLIMDFDRVLGLKLDSVPEMFIVPSKTKKTLRHRHLLREMGEYTHADALRQQLKDQGYAVNDGPLATSVRPVSTLEHRTPTWSSFSSSKEVFSRLEEQDAVEFTIAVVACNYKGDVQRCVEGALAWANGQDVELLVVDNGSTDGTGHWLEAKARSDRRLRSIHIDHILGQAAAINVALKQSRGTYIVQLDTCAEVVGDVFSPLRRLLSNLTTGVTGPFGLRTADLRHFHDVTKPTQVDAMQGYFFAFRRDSVRKVGLMPETFRFYRNLDLIYSFRFKRFGYNVINAPYLPVRLHQHRQWSDMAPDVRQHLSMLNFKRFLKEFGHSRNLLVSQEDHDAV